jgi:hypothetical protein
MRNLVLLLVVLGFPFLWYVVMVIYPVQFIRDELPYHGKVVDAKTGDPVADVVVVAAWYRHFPTPAGGMQRFYDAREVVTDANGDYTMPGMGFRFLSTLGPPEFLFFKVGYEYLGPYRWDTFKEDPILSPKIKWEGEKAIIPLRKLTLRQRKKRLIGRVGGVPHHKQRLLIRELNKERIELGRRDLYEEPES